MGTSTCHLVLGDELRLAEGMCGVVEDGIIPGWYGYEAGQSAVGDIFAWFIRTGVPPFRVASYYLDSCSFRAEDVTVELLLTTAVGRVVEGVRRMVELHLKQREPTLTPGPACGWCPRREACDGPALWAAERAARGLDPFD